MKKRYSLTILLAMLTFSSTYQPLFAAEPARASGDNFNLSALGVDMAFAELFNNERGFYVSTDGKLYGSNEEDVDSSRPKQSDTTTFNYLFNTHDYMPFLDDEVIIDVEIMGSSRFLLTESNKVFVDGFNNSGQLGNGTTTPIDTFTDVTSFFPNLDDSTIIAIEHSGNATYVLTDDGRVYTYGLLKVLGDNTASTLFGQQHPTPVEITEFFVNYDRNIDPIIQISLGAALTESGVVYAWGNHFTSYLVPTSVFDNSLLNAGDNIVSILSMESGMLVLSNEGRVFGIGSNANFALGFSNSASTYSTFTELSTSTFAIETGDKINFLGQGFLISDFGRVFSWGSHDSGNNRNGKTGQGEDIINPTVPLAEINAVVYDHLADGEKFVFGRNKTQATASVLITNQGRAVSFGSGFATGYPNVGTSAPYFLGVTVNPGKVTYTIDTVGGPTVGPFYWAKEYRVYYNTMLPTSFNNPNLITFPNYTFVGYFTDSAFTNPLPTFDIVFAEEDTTIYARFVFTGSSSSQPSQPGSSTPTSGDSTTPGTSQPGSSTPTSGDSITPGTSAPIRILPILGVATVVGLGGGSVYWFVILKKSVRDLQSFFFALLKKKKKAKDEDDLPKKK